MAKSLTNEKLSKHRVICDRFVVALLRGHAPRQAAIMAGVPMAKATKKAQELMGDPYVSERYEVLYGEINEEELVTRKDILFGLLQEAKDKFSPGGTQAARVSAWNALARLTGVDKPQKVDVNVNGIMLVPVQNGGVEEWERLASSHQQDLKDAVRR